MDEFTNWDIISSLLLAMRWTVLLSLIAFAGGTLITIVLLLLSTLLLTLAEMMERRFRRRWGKNA